MKVLISKKTGNTYYTQGKEDYHCKEGIISKEDMDSGESIVYSHLGKEFLVFNGTNYDIAQKYKRGPQLVNPKDLGYILSRTFVDKESSVLEAGGGSGAATCFFAKLLNKVYSFEEKEENIKIINKNLALQNVENVELKQGDINQHIEEFEKNTLDLVFLDLPNPQQILEKNLDCLKNGHYIVCYLPSITQILDVVEIIKDREEYYLEEVSEIIKREWKTWGRVARPLHRKENDHTAFLMFIRKI